MPAEKLTPASLVCGCKPFIFAASLPRTGTNSLKIAFEQLSLGPVCHFFIIEERGDSKAWIDALREPSTTDWRAFLGAYGAACDEPVCSVSSDIIRCFADGMLHGDGSRDAAESSRIQVRPPRQIPSDLPRCTARRCHRPIKVILITRSSSAWWASMQATILRLWTPGTLSLNLQQFLSRFRPDGGKYWYHIELMKHNRVERLHEDYMDNHVETVRAAVRDANRALAEAGSALTVPLLEYQVKEGWTPLCHFLGVSIPDLPFPRVNDAESFNSRYRSDLMASAGWGLLWMSIAVVGGTSLLRGWNL
ncbi:hypothetical protein BOTBODRAFT_361023 [Botryobasidium botryosum FD-172 SS1]|uniref:Sulfotransferase domain-containing protein n=1 Tax=Botryobasidium botryosum (strain FD-172 SS1) TaxID=930990 RepID=A0A067ME25_BOTB1|nr:hypothetical protein BOTBODRAFT_361023 [Botryobasidium botryosum FD-172 SS1]